MAVTFMATISMLQSAIQIAGDGGARLKLDLDDTQLDAIVALSAMRGEVLRVTVEVEQGLTYGKSTAEKAATRNPLDVAGSRL